MIEQNKNGSSQNKKNFFYALALGSELGFLIAFPLVIFLLLGVFLDEKLDSAPWFLIIFVFVGLIATFLDIYYLVIPFLRKKSSNKQQ